MIPARKTPAAVKHAVYSSLAVLPGEDEGAFKKLQTRLSDEYAPSGPSEEAIVTELAGLLWRKQHLSTFQKAKDLQARAAYLESLQRYKVSNITVMAIPICITLDARDCAREEMGEENFALVDNPSATFDQLERELDLTDRLDAKFVRCLKNLLLVRGIKSLANSSPAPAAPRQLRAVGK